MCWGAAAHEKNGSTTSKIKTVTIEPKIPLPGNDKDKKLWQKGPRRAFTPNVCKKSRQKALDTKTLSGMGCHRQALWA
jgi:hypothetical protein